MHKQSFLTACALALTVTTVSAQTSLSRGKTPPTPNERIAAAPAQEKSVNTRPVTPDAIEQANKQLLGEFGYMGRAASVGGQIQKAWDRAGRKAGVHTQTACGDCVYRVRVREFMVTALQLPADVVVKDADLGDTRFFELEKRSDNTLIVRPLKAGVDTSLQVYAKSGEVYSFYLRAEAINSKNVPDLTYRIERRRAPMRSYVAFDTAGNPKQVSVPAMAAETGTDTGVTPVGPDDFVKEAKFDPSRIRWDGFKLWGDKELKPESVYRDDYFTYIQFGERWTEMELPTAYVVVDEIDELVNTRVSGTTFIIESVNPLITLKSGAKYMCIEYGGA